MPATVGHLQFLWWWALDYAHDGSLAGYDDADVADAALWEGDASLFVAGLVAAGFVDEDGQGRRIHDWEEYAGRLVAQRLSNKERKRTSRAGHAAVTGPSQGRHTPVTAVSAAVTALQNPTQPDPTEPNRTQHNSTAPDPRVNALEDDVLPLVSDSLTKCLRAWEEETGTLVPRSVGDSMMATLEDIPEDWVLDAIRETGFNGKKNWSYTMAILSRWRDEGRDRERDVGDWSESVLSQEELLAHYGKSRIKKLEFGTKEGTG